MLHDQTRPNTASRRTNNIEAEPAARRGRPVGDHEAKQAELLKAAIAVIAEVGYGEASLRKVAQRAGCTAGAVTYYFANKEAMVAAVVQSLFDEFDTLLVAGEQENDVKSIYERWLNWVASKTDSRLALSQLLAQARHEPAFADTFQQRYGQYRRTFTSIVAAGQSQGTIRNDIPADLLADQLCAIGDGYATAFPIETKRFKPKRIQALLEATMTMISPAAAAKKTKKSP